MIPGLMQKRQLQIIDILKFAAQAHPAVEIVSRGIDEPIFRYNYKNLLRRSSQAARALQQVGVKPGDRVATLAWNTHRHLELFYAVPGIAGVLHTVNPRLSDDHIIYIINHAESAVLVFERTFIPLVERLSPSLTSVRTFILLSDVADDTRGPARALCYEAMLAGEQDHFEWPDVEENAGAILCYTSGTTGDPKGVLYSHRAIVLHALAAGLSGAFSITAFDVIMPCASMYHATAWGLPYIAPINGAKLVLPADKMSGEALHELIVTESVTFTGGVPTIWTMYLDHLTRSGGHTHALQRVMIGGSAVPQAMARTFAERYGVKVLQIWGMTELCPMGVVATPTPALLSRGETYAQDVIWSRQGRLQFGVEIKVITENGTEVPNDGITSGALLVRGPWTVQRYFKAKDDAVDSKGWFDTGDVVTLDGEGYIRITDRRKDVIKSGGEWISSIDLENAAAGFPGVKIAAVIGVPHPKWEERPVLVIEPHGGATVVPDEIMAHLANQVAKWCLPDAIYIDTIPQTATGKVNKQELRQRYAKHKQQSSLLNGKVS